MILFTACPEGLCYSQTNRVPTSIVTGNGITPTERWGLFDGSVDIIKEGGPLSGPCYILSLGVFNPDVFHLTVPPFRSETHRSGNPLMIFKSQDDFNILLQGFKISRYFKSKCPTLSVRTLYIFYCEDTGFSVPSGTFPISLWTMYGMSSEVLFHLT